MAGVVKHLGAHVLVIDDDEDILRLLTMRLQARVSCYTAVGSAEQALVQMRLILHGLCSVIYVCQG